MHQKPLFIAICLFLATGSSVQAQTSRYELFPEPDVRKTPTNLVNSAYVVDKKDNQFWICTARYDFPSKDVNKGECSRLPSDIGRPSLTERYESRAVVGSTSFSSGDLVHRADDGRRPILCPANRGYLHQNEPAVADIVSSCMRNSKLMAIKA